MTSLPSTKRIVDLSIIAVAAIPASVIGAACALAVKATSKGPVLFKQERVGLHGAPFEIYKFRSMVHGPNPVVPEPARITPVGRILRRWSLDELPQLINVARGDMSIVGPRPTLGYQVDRYTARQQRRLEVRPGLTGHAQVNGRNTLSWDDRIALDVEYVERQSLALDLSILVKTVKTLLSGEGVEGHQVTDPLVDVREQPLDLDIIDVSEPTRSASSI